MVIGERIHSRDYTKYFMLSCIIQLATFFTINKAKEHHICLSPEYIMICMRIPCVHASVSNDYDRIYRSNLRQMALCMGGTVLT